MRKLFTILFVSLSTVMFAQTTDSMGSWIAKVNTTALTDITTFPTIQLSVEKKDLWEIRI